MIRPETMGARCDRERLPDRRTHELLDFEHGGILYTAGVGRFEDGRLAEIFLNTAKHGTAVDTFAKRGLVAVATRPPARNLAPRSDAKRRRFGIGPIGTRS
jgi:hypothetical protein